MAATKVVSSGLWNQELFVLHSAMPLHYYHRYTHTPAHAVQPLLCSGLVGMLTFTLTHPLCSSHPSVCKIGTN